MDRLYSFDTTITCECCGNPDWEVKATATYTSAWTVEDIKAVGKRIGNQNSPPQSFACIAPLVAIELSVSQGDRLVIQAAERWEAAKKEYEDALAEANFEMQKDDLLH